MAPSGFLMKSCEWPRIKGIEKDMALLLANETEKGAGAVKIKYIYWKQEWWTSRMENHSLLVCLTVQKLYSKQKVSSDFTKDSHASGWELDH